MLSHYIRPDWLSRVSFVEGDVRQTTKTFDAPIALLHLDLDIYDAYRHALVNLYPRGGLVLLDEYRSPKWTGAEFFRLSEIQRSGERGFLVKREQ
jgi:hypothetical protein